MFVPIFSLLYSESPEQIKAAMERKAKERNDEFFSSVEEEFPKKLEDAGFNAYMYKSLGRGLSGVIQYKKYPNIWARVNFNEDEQSGVVAFQYYVNHNKWSMFEITLLDLIRMTKWDKVNLHSEMFSKERFENLAELAIKRIQPELPPEYMFHYESDDIVKDFDVDFFLKNDVQPEYIICHIEYGGGTELDGEFNFGHIVQDHIRFDETQFKLVKMFVHGER